uniref:Uncharacterized protein n=1 Tax=viral metagenome TaxID=1070528 RepID=A0A6C0CL31_9ZZZZ
MKSELEQFKNSYKGQTVVLIGPGPSLKDVDLNTFDKSFKRCAVNGSILHPKVITNLDFYIWAGDLDIPKHPTPSYGPIMNTIPKLNKNTIKFTNCWTDGSIIHSIGVQTQIHPDDAKQLGFYRYNQINKNVDPVNVWHKDIGDQDKGPSGYSVAFHAMQILLYMGFEKIILVGFDCSGGHSYKEMLKNDACDWIGMFDDLIQKWKSFKNWVENISYKDVKIYSYKPVGLKGVFEEWV